MNSFTVTLRSDTVVRSHYAELYVLFLRYQPPGEAHKEWYAIENKGKQTGEVELMFTFFPAGKLTITCIQGRRLIDTDTVGSQDPYDDEEL